MRIEKLSTFPLVSEALRHQRSIFVDVDDTLLLHDNFTQPPRLNEALLAQVRLAHAQGVQTVLWSGQGREYVLEVAERYYLRGAFDAFLAKPHIIVDDQVGWFDDCAIVVDAKA